MVHPRRGAAPARPFRRRRVEGQGLPPLPARGAAAKIVAVANFKGGVGKTSTAAHLAMSAALDGYRVLVVDLDSQGSMTSIFGGRVADEWQTAFPLLARHYAEYLRSREPGGRAGGRRPKARRDAERGAQIVRTDLIQTTHWPNIDLIGAQLDLYWAEFQIPVWRMQGRGWKLWDALGDRLEADGVLDDYDIVVILDTPPALGYLTINALAAADILLVPLGASFLEFDSTGRFFDMLHATFSSIEETRTWPPAPWACRRPLRMGRGARGADPL
jgi:chromosome partitioning protein